MSYKRTVLVPSDPLRRLLVACVLASMLPAPLAGGDSLAAEPAAHRHHEHSMSELGAEFRVLRVDDLPPGVGGNLAVDRDSGRVWMLSSGPPANTHGPSTLYELHLAEGRVGRSAQLPFEGELGGTVFIDGALFQIVSHESRLYKISIEPESFGKILEVVALPTLNDITVDESVPLRFPFISFGGVSKTADNRLVAHCKELGEFLTIDPATGVILDRVPTLRALGDISVVEREPGERFVLANSDPIRGAFDYYIRREMFRGSHGSIPILSHGKQALHWVLLDGRTGEILASLRRLDPETDYASVTLVNYERLEASPYGRFTFLTTGEDGVFTVEWTPGVKS